MFLVESRSCRRRRLPWSAAGTQRGLEAQALGRLRLPRCLAQRSATHHRPSQRLQFRVLDVLRAVSALKPRPDLKGMLRLEIWDWVLSPDRPVPAVFSIEEGQVKVHRTHKKAPILRTTIHAFSQIFSGLLLPSRAAAMGVLEVGNHATLKLADNLFFGRTPFRSGEEPG